MCSNEAHWSRGGWGGGGNLLERGEGQCGWGQSVGKGGKGNMVVPPTCGSGRREAIPPPPIRFQVVQIFFSSNYKVICKMIRPSAGKKKLRTSLITNFYTFLWLSTANTNTIYLSALCLFNNYPPPPPFNFLS